MAGSMCMRRKSPGPEFIIAEEIGTKGPLTFARFMELALYEPEHGYYASGHAQVGRGGDFYTNVSVGPVYGRVLAGQFREMWENLGKPGDLVIVEQGAHGGDFAADVLGAADFPTRYRIVEPAEALRKIQEERLKEFNGQVEWTETLAEMTEFQGVHFSNELVDALPFHLVRSTGSGWEELFVTTGANGFEFTGAKPSLEIMSEMAELPERAEGYVTELRPVARNWIHTVAEKLQRGYVLAVDYGFSREQLLAEHRTEGTFSCYRSHRRDAKPLEDAGLKDITAHVDFTALSEAAEAAGLKRECWTDQHHFMVGAAEKLMRAWGAPTDAAAQKTLRGLQTLLHPASMGTQFSYLAFSKGVAEKATLSGFRYARAVG